jgi:hypothetical protein
MGGVYVLIAQLDIITYIAKKGEYFANNNIRCSRD